MINPLGPDRSYMSHGSYGKKNRPGAKGFKSGRSVFRQGINFLVTRKFAFRTNPTASGQLFLS